ncbi:hypothetical protein HRG_004004 [Hirsutella rhossiliensis]|uniref:Uncharacterized protein n=1 Tax=Hirsutella rhossiliensis TaxID=111463 RepID=A0A9P8SK53_9HYPO|nr:uncharacterized protein HRG_04004 [Hirsutella rhossiliensis]KAH0965988.1 hypothetical protein HRG_04004 [Hirsutella rhossiliensis]
MSLWGIDRVERLLKSGTGYVECFIILRVERMETLEPRRGVSRFGQKTPYWDESEGAVNALWARMDPTNLAQEEVLENLYRALVCVNRNGRTLFDDESRYPVTCRLPTPADLRKSES